ncbi:MAG: hypothetical protein OEL56_06510 [Nitrosopumilus sp.]|nr:hypothetical protein [Nitrosopumilus sp.]MDH3565143.1 hypothetical protein [Nitrosopumilus sp.]MDH5416895.1 hypothetical protein [Nitrosopumilus sp.]
MSEKTDQKDSSDDVDVFTSVEQSFDKMHNSVERLTPRYTQSLTNLQQEIHTAWKNLTCSSISVQRQYAEKIGLNTISSDLLTQIIQKMAEETNRSFEIQSNIVQTFLEMSKQNIQIFNENATTFAEWQKKFIDPTMNDTEKDT